MKKLMILDGNSVVNRAFYGVRPLNAPDGTPTNAVYGFLAILQKLFEGEAPDSLCVAFDLPAPTFRHEMYEGYKAQRKPMPEELAVQMPLLKETLDAMHIRRLEAAGWEADDVLDEAVDALPPEIFNKLNGGVNLLPARRTDENGLLVMGMYFVDQMGRHVEIYYGSFRERYAAAAPERWRRELTRTLKHELTHHIENLAYDRSLERWDAEHVAQLLQGLEDEPLEAESILFVDADGAGLAAIACAMFEQAARDEGCPELRAGFASAGEPVPAPEPKAVKAAAKYGLDISKRTTRAADRAALESYDVALCMTEAQGDALAARWPEFDERIICLGETDITPPRFSTQGGWDRLADRLAEEVRYLLDELLGEEEDDDT